MSRNNIRFSIICPLRDKGPYVAEMIRSVRAQSLEDWELIVVDNGSSDRGPETVREAGAGDRRVRLMATERRGPGAARNAGMAEASGNWVLFLDADDLLEPDHLERLWTAAEEHPRVEMAVSSWQEFSGPPCETRLVHPLGWPGGREAVLDRAFARAPWAVHCALIRREVPGGEIRWPEALDAHPSEDSGFWFPLLLRARMRWSGSSGALYRKLAGEGRNQQAGPQAWVEGVIDILAHNEEALRTVGKRPNDAQCREALRLLEERYWIARRTGQTAAASAALGEAKRWLDGIARPALAERWRRRLGIGPVVWLEKLGRRMKAEG